MNKRRGGLGSGLDALIPTPATPTTAIRDVPVSAIQPNRSQPRTVFEQQALDELAASIREYGLIQPLIVTTGENGRYELVAGERRWRASQLAGLERVPVLVRDVAPQRLLELALVENIQRADLNPIEEGRAYEALKDEFRLTDEEIARRVGKGRVAVTNSRRLLGLPPAAQSALLDGSITAGHGRAILMLEQSDEQAAMLDAIRGGDLSVRAAERLANLAADARLNDAARRALLQGTITTSQAQALLRLANADDQSAVLEAVLIDGLSVRETEQMCDSITAGSSPAAARSQLRTQTKAAAPSETANTNAVNNSADNTATQDTAPRSLSPEDNETIRLFEQALGTDVQLVRSGKTIRLTINMYNEEQLQGLYDLVASHQE